MKEFKINEDITLKLEDGKPNIYIEGELLQYEFFLLERLEKMASGIYEPLTEDFYEIVENYKEIPSEFLIIFLKALLKNMGKEKEEIKKLVIRSKIIEALLKTSLSIFDLIDDDPLIPSVYRSMKINTTK